MLTRCESLDSLHPSAFTAHITRPLAGTHPVGDRVDKGRNQACRGWPTSRARGIHHRRVVRGARIPAPIARRKAVGQASASTDGETSGTAGNTNIHLDPPFPPGTLAQNMRIGVVVVGTTSDEIDELEKEKDFKEEQFDQVLRSICLRFGARSSSPTRKTPRACSDSGPTPSIVSLTNWSPPRQLPDSWGKIKILRDPSIVGNGWLFDLEKPLRTRPDRVGDDRQEGGSSIDDDQVGYDSEGRKILINSHDRVITTQEQQFLRTKYDAIKEERDVDPRSHFQLNHKGHAAQQAVKFTNGTILSDKSLINSAGPGVAGLGTAGVEEEITAQLKLLSLRDQQGNPNGRSSNAGLSPVETIHMHQQQQQQQGKGSDGTGGTQSAGEPGSPLAASRSSSQLAHQRHILIGPASSTPVGTPGGRQGGKRHARKLRRQTP
ncbi:hypothetical protein PtA15_9A454 [Puccinia triticina]|uniref:Uncharacterized protein n=1 Tax=Puccinia triticina TaxID=208348 RepID=A0ABY7CV56_9BASI|nr:uncharacterized protein PtA15_9A454 [Puccinia triticina]WAQ88327.1 hypothetical protein PtA15_9A454 [Puccinia triticina]